MNKPQNITSASEVRILSELAGGDLSPTELAERAEIERASLYVHLRRLAKRELVTNKPDRDAPGAVVYKITVKGRKAREEFAKRTGLAV